MNNPALAYVLLGISFIFLFRSLYFTWHKEPLIAIADSLTGFGIIVLAIGFLF